MLPVEGHSESWSSGKGESRVKVTGMAGAPEVNRSRRGYLSFFVNRRWVTNRILAIAVEEAYAGLMMTGRHPVAVIWIEPARRKRWTGRHSSGQSEVKFRNKSEVFRAVQRAIRQALVAKCRCAQIEEPAALYTGQPFRRPELVLPGEEETKAPGRVYPGGDAACPAGGRTGHGLLILAEGPDGLYVIDQHAAHERIRYEQLFRQRAQRSIEVQGLLQPASFELTPRQSEISKS